MYLPQESLRVFVCSSNNTESSSKLDLSSSSIDLSASYRYGQLESGSLCLQLSRDIKTAPTMSPVVTSMSSAISEMNLLLWLLTFNANYIALLAAVHQLPSCLNS